MLVACNRRATQPGGMDRRPSWARTFGELYYATRSQLHDVPRHSGQRGASKRTELSAPSCPIAAEKAREAGIAVVTVGYGTRAGSTIPVREDGRVVLKRDDAGAVVTTRYDPAQLQEAARVARGTFVPADSPDRRARQSTAAAPGPAQASRPARGRD